jgi:hypothetical protein
MPLVRLELPRPFPPPAPSARATPSTRRSSTRWAVPADDRFQLITRHPPGALVCTPEYLGVRHTANALFVR